MPADERNASDAKPYRPPPVEIEEMSFAISLFAAALKGRIAPAKTGFIAFTQQERRAFQRDPMLLGAQSVLPEKSASGFDEVLLVRGVGVVWEHYARDLRKQALCSRLVAFYALMVRDRGYPLEADAGESTFDLSAAALSPAIVEAVATAEVGDSGQFDGGEFDAILNRVAKREGQSAVSMALPDRKKHVSGPSKAPFPVTKAVQQLSVQLFAFQLCIAADPSEEIQQFQVVEQLCVRVAAVSGNAALEGMLSRALRATIPEFPWLQSEQPSAAKTLGGLKGIRPPNVQEAIGCEIAILGALIELLRLLLGDVVTVQLLRSLWPLASLDAEDRVDPEPARMRPRGGLAQQTDRTQ